MAQGGGGCGQAAGFDEAKNKALGKYPQATGKQAEVLKKIATAVTPEVKAWVKNWLKNRHNVKF